MSQKTLLSKHDMMAYTVGVISNGHALVYVTFNMFIFTSLYIIHFVLIPIVAAIFFCLDLRFVHRADMLKIVTICSDGKQCPF